MGPTALVRVGPSQMSFRLPQALLCRQSDFFHTTFHSGFKEANEASMSLPDVDPSTFATVVKWMYQGHLNDLKGIRKSDYCEEIGQIEAAAKHRQRLHHLFELYYLAEKLLMEPLEVQICKLLQDLMVPGRETWTLAPRTILNAFEKTSFTAKSPLWGFICDELANQLGGGLGRPIEDYQECFDKIPGLAVKVMKEAQRRQGYGFYLPDESDEGQL